MDCLQMPHQAHTLLTTRVRLVSTWVLGLHCRPQPSVPHHEPMEGSAILRQKRQNFEDATGPDRSITSSEPGVRREFPEVLKKAYTRTTNHRVSDDTSNQASMPRPNPASSIPSWKRVTSKAPMMRTVHWLRRLFRCRTDVTRRMVPRRWSEGWPRRPTRRSKTNTTSVHRVRHLAPDVVPSNYSAWIVI